MRRTSMLVGALGVLLLVLAGLWLLIAILTVPCIAIAIGISAAVSDSDSLAFGPLAQGSSLLVATLGPLILMAWLAWVINAPPAKRGAIIPGAAGLAALLPTVSGVSAYETDRVN